MSISFEGPEGESGGGASLQAYSPTLGSFLVADGPVETAPDAEIEAGG